MNYSAVMFNIFHVFYVTSFNSSEHKNHCLKFPSLLKKKKENVKKIKKLKGKIAPNTIGKSCLRKSFNLSSSYLQCFFFIIKVVLQ